MSLKPSLLNSAYWFFKLLYILSFAIATLIVVSTLFSVVSSEPTLWLGLLALRETLSPFNVINYLMIILFYLPGLIFLKVSEFLKSHLDKKERAIAKKGGLPVVTNQTPPYTVVLIDATDAYYYADIMGKREMFATVDSYQMAVTLANALFITKNYIWESLGAMNDLDAGYDVRVYDSQQNCIYMAHTRFKEEWIDKVKISK